MGWVVTGIVYFSLDQFPKSISLQRSEQNGVNGPPGLTSFLQMGQSMSLF